MGKRGPKRTPTAALKARGSWRGKKRERDGEPEPPAGRPQPTEDLQRPEFAAALAKWQQLVPVLEHMKVLTIADGDALARYCICWQQWRECVRFIARHGTTLPKKQYIRTHKDEKGVWQVAEKLVGLAPVPQVAQANQLAQQLARLEKEFGLTPAARSEVGGDVGGRETNEILKDLIGR